MNNILSVFSIRDLENLTGIKAHTIRIWEKRYKLLSPMRNKNNIRIYSLESLRKLLNIQLLHQHGYKLSRISKLPEEQLPQVVRQIISEKSVKSHAISAFKLAMMNFDQTLFIRTYNELLSRKTFPEVFYEVFLPLLEEIGLLWQTTTINPAHEHFISYLIGQKILVHTEQLQLAEPVNTQRVYVLFLPEYELHELGLMYLNYEITARGYKSIYLGENIPVGDLLDLRERFEHITFVTYFTVAPQRQPIEEYVQAFSKEVLLESSEFWILGKRTRDLKKKDYAKVRIFESIGEAVDALQ